MELPKAYEPGNYEEKIIKKWADSKFSNPDNLSGDPYTIMMPPPNVTGVLHLGHALENALMDTMARYQRMQGKKVLLVPGTDHAPIATQAKVEKMLMANGVKNPRQELGREKLVAEIKKFALESQTTIISQIKRMGTSCDWGRQAYTFDDARNAAVNEMFVRMYNDKLIYRGMRVVNWSVKGQSTCSDDEMVHVERPAKLYTFKYSKDFPITIATTRPETKLGDTAVAVNPGDKRYKKYIGKEFVVDVGAAKPLTIKIIADEGVDANFGTGALGVTPAHSPIDFVMYEKQKAAGNPIELIQVIGTDGKMTAEAGKEYAGLYANKAREKFVEWLKENNLLEKEEDIVQNVGTSDRFGDVIEAIPMTQWWLDMNREIPGRGKSLKDFMREAVTTGLNNDPKQKVTITPDRFTKLYLDRVENLRDWCLSRQIWFGHQIPVWYKGEEIHCATTAPAGDGWVRDTDTLDTWFSSGSWPFSTLGWPSETKDLKTFYPTNWMQMGYEILYLWMMRMILMGTYVTKQIPFKDVYIHGILRDESGKKFSKSSGNNIDPLDVIKEFGTDALRISVLSGISPGNDSKFYEEKIEGARNLVNKLWNIARFMLIQIEKPVIDVVPKLGKDAVTLADSWLLDRLERVRRVVTDNLNQFNFSYASEVLRDFTWGELADWYLEVAKVEGNKAVMLNYVFNTILKMWHPFAPFVTEAIWQEVYGADQLLMVAPWPATVPVGDMYYHDNNLPTMAESDFEILRKIVGGVRAARSENKIEPAKMLKVTMVTQKHMGLLENNAEIIKKLARLDSLTITGKAAKPDNAVAFVEGGVEVFVDLGEVADPAKEKERITKEIADLEKYIKGVQAKLGNQDFVARAPEAVVAGEKKKLADAVDKCAKLAVQLKSLK